MNSRDYILAKQVAWAKSQGIQLIGSQGERGAKVYTSTLDENLFEPLSAEARKTFESGDGGELGGSEHPGKMQALHSSSALGANVFHYWNTAGDTSEIAALCGFCSKNSASSEKIVFEDKYVINRTFPRSPNIDVVIHTAEDAKIKRFAVECKFTEAYGNYGHSGLSPRYLEECGNLWDDMPNLKAFAKRISPDDQEFRHLHPAQLIKHILGLKHAFGKEGFCLLYLWYDVPGQDGARHHAEVEEFSAIAKADGSMLHAMTYQELILKMTKKLGPEHEGYVQYLANRYL